MKAKISIRTEMHYAIEAEGLDVLINVWKDTASGAFAVQSKSRGWSRAERIHRFLSGVQGYAGTAGNLTEYRAFFGAGIEPAVIAEVIRIAKGGRERRPR